MKIKSIFILGFMTICIITKGAETNAKYDKLVDYLNCKLVELSINKTNKTDKLKAFNNKCECNTADFSKINSGLAGLDLNRTLSLAKDVNNIKKIIVSVESNDQFKQSFTDELKKTNSKQFYNDNADNIKLIFESEEFKSKLGEVEIQDAENLSKDSLLNKIEEPKNETETEISDTVNSDAEETGNKVLLYFSNIFTNLGLPILVIILIIFLFKKNKKQPSTESILNAILTDPKVKEYIQRIAQPYNNTSNNSNINNQINDLISKVNILEKTLQNVKNDSNYAMNTTIPHSNSETIRKEEKVEIFYLSTPNLDGSFNDSSSSPNYREGASIYKLTKTGSNKAKFEIDSKSDSVKLAVKYPDKNIDPVCDAQNAFNANATRIVTVQPGEVELQGDKWIKIIKAKIRYES